MTTQKQAARRLFIDVVKRHVRPGTGSSLELLRARTARLKVPDLTQTLSGIPWAVVGAIAARSYMAERATSDLDIAILPMDAAEVAHRFRVMGFTFKERLANVRSSWVAPDGFPVDVIELPQPWGEEALLQAQKNLQPPGNPTLPMPYLVLIKLEAGRGIDLGDVTRMLGRASGDELEEVRSLFQRCAAEDMEDLESLITLGRMEFETDQPRE